MLFRKSRRRSAAAVVFKRFIEIAIDIEYIINVEDNTNFNFCSDNEHQLFEDHSHNFNNNFKNTIYWSAKESLSKFIGTGLNIIYEILEIESIVQIDENVLFINYKNIKAAKTIVFVFIDLVISITIPYSTNIDKAKDFYNSFSKYYTNFIS